MARPNYFNQWQFANRKPIQRLGKLSSVLYERIHSKINVASHLGFKSRMIHLADAVDCGTITPMEAYDAINQLETMGYLPIWIEARKSNYDHVI